MDGKDWRERGGRIDAYLERNPPWGSLIGSRELSDFREGFDQAVKRAFDILSAVPHGYSRFSAPFSLSSQRIFSGVIGRDFGRTPAAFAIAFAIAAIAAG